MFEILIAILIIFGPMLLGIAIYLASMKANHSTPTFYDEVIEGIIKRSISVELDPSKRKH